MNSSNIFVIIFVSNICYTREVFSPIQNKFYNQLNSIVEDAGFTDMQVFIEYSLEIHYI